MVLPEFSPAFKQAWTISAVLMNMIGQGMVLSFSTSLLPALQAPDSPIVADLHTASWLASAFSLCSMPGYFISSVLMHLYGRKIAHALVVLPGIAGWLCIYFAGGIPSLMIGRILTGLSTGATVCLGAVVIGEYSSPKLRGVFLNLKTASLYIGSMLVHILGHFYSWRTIAMQAVLPHVLALIIICTWPESPAWLASKQQFEKSEKSFYWLQGKTESSTKELEALIKVQMTSPLTKRELSFMEKALEFLMKFTKKNFLKPLMNVVVSIILLDACGRHFFPAYALQIIGEITSDKSQAYYYTFCIDVIITISILISSVLVKFIKRRTLLFSTGFAAFFVLMIACAFLFLKSRDIISLDYAWIPIAIFIVYFILVNLACTPIPLALLGELYPLEHRGAGAALSGVMLSLCAMSALHVTPYLLVSIKVYGTFTVFGVVMGTSLMILYFTLPETKDKTLQEIEDYFKHGRFIDDKADDDAEANVKMVH